MPIFICVPPKTATEMSIRVPGWADRLRSIKEEIDSVPSPLGLAMRMLQQATPILAPFIALLRIAEFVIAIFDCIKAILDVFPSLSPDKIKKAKEAAEKLNQLLGNLIALAPGIAWIALVRDLLYLLTSIIRGLANIITTWINELNLILMAVTGANLLNEPEMAQAAVCAKGRLFEVQLASSVSLNDIGQLLKITTLLINICNKVVPLPNNPLSQVEQQLSNLSTQMVGSHSVNPTVISQEISNLQAVATTFNETADTMDNFVAALTAIVGV